MRWATIAVACVLLLAGCSGTDPIGGDTPETETVSPVPVPETPTPTPTPDPGSYPPGISPNGSVNTTALLVAHDRSLANTSYTWTLSYNRSVPAEKRVSEAFTRQVRYSGDEDFAVSVTRPGDWSDRTTYADATGGYVRVIDGESVVATRTMQSPEPWFYVTTGEHVGVYLDASSASVVTVDDRDQQYYRVHTTTPPPRITVRHPGASISNYTATAYVTSEGFVRTLSVEYNVTLVGRTSHVSIRIDHSDVGSTTVEWPEWAVEMRRTTEAVVDTPIDLNATATPATPDPATAAGTTTTSDATTAHNSTRPTTTDAPRVAVPGHR